MRSLRSVAVLAAALSLATAAFAAPEFRIAPSSPQPGQPIFVTLSPDRDIARVSCTWSGKSYDFSPVSAGYEVIVPVSAAAKPGGYHLDVTWKYADGAVGSQSLPIQVRPRTFGIQRLRLPAREEAKYEDPEVKHEYALIGAALNKVTPQVLWEEDFLMPVRGRVSTTYGLQRYVNGHFDYRHKGMDIAARMGTPVKAAADGVVSLADGSFHLHGKTIIIDHGLGVSTLYLHLSRIDVASGTKVKRGQVIGEVGRTGAATGPHLHYGVYVHREAMDPVFWTHLPARQ